MRLKESDEHDCSDIAGHDVTLAEATDEQLAARIQGLQSEIRVRKGKSRANSANEERRVPADTIQEIEKQIDDIWNELARRLFRPIEGIVYSHWKRYGTLLQRSYEPADLVNESFILIHRKLHIFDPKRGVKLTTWASTVVLNLLLSLGRSANRLYTVFNWMTGDLKFTLRMPTWMDREARLRWLEENVEDPAELGEGKIQAMINERLPPRTIPIDDGHEGAVTQLKGPGNVAYNPARRAECREIHDRVHDCVRTIERDSKHEHRIFQAAIRHVLDGDDYESIEKDLGVNRERVYPVVHEIRMKLRQLLKEFDL